MEIKRTSGKINFLRVHERGTKYGPDNDQLDAELIVRVEGDLQSYGLGLQNNDNLPAAEAMFSLLLEAFNANIPVTIEYKWEPGRNNHYLFRVIISK